MLQLNDKKWTQSLTIVSGLIYTLVQFGQAQGFLPEGSGEAFGGVNQAAAQVQGVGLQLYEAGVGLVEAVSGFLTLVGLRRAAVS
jgi:hypothetical protein